MSRQAFTRHTGVLVPIMRPNIDTDAIIPSREMKQVSRTGLAPGLFAGWRYQSAAARTPNTEFVLNQPAYTGASVLAAGRNFGCGSSREHAVWALAEFGIRVIIAPSFGAIFERNCVNNGVLPVRMNETAIEQLLQHTTDNPQSHRVTADLEAGHISTTNGFLQRFSLAQTQRHMLLLGLDPIDLSLEHQADIERFLERDRQNRPWVYRWNRSI